MREYYDDEAKMDEEGSRGDDHDYGEDDDDFNEEEIDKEYETHHKGTNIVLMVAEKPSIAKSIAEALCYGKLKNRRGISKFCPVYEFSGSIFGKNAYFRVTSVAGHVYTTDFPPKYQDWKRTDPLELFQAETIKKEANPKVIIMSFI